MNKTLDKCGKHSDYALEKKNKQRKNLTIELKRCTQELSRNYKIPHRGMPENPDTKYFCKYTLCSGLHRWSSSSDDTDFL